MQKCARCLWEAAFCRSRAPGVNTLRGGGAGGGGEVQGGPWTPWGSCCRGAVVGGGALRGRGRAAGGAMGGGATRGPQVGRGGQQGGHREAAGGGVAVTVMSQACPFITGVAVASARTF